MGIFSRLSEVTEVNEVKASQLYMKLREKNRFSISLPSIVSVTRNSPFLEIIVQNLDPRERERQHFDGEMTRRVP